MSAAVDSVQATSPLGASIPALVPHAISVSLPTWKDVVGYEEGEKRVVDAMQTGYPRFFVHLSIQKVSVHVVASPSHACSLTHCSSVDSVVSHSSPTYVYKSLVSPMNCARSFLLKKSLKTLDPFFSSSRHRHRVEL